MRLDGSAVLHFLKSNYSSQISLDLASGHIEVWFRRPKGTFPLEQLWSFSEKDQPVLSNIRLAAPFGELHAASYDDFFVVRHRPSWYSLDGEIDTSTDVFVETPATITHLTLQPSHSRLPFTLVTADPDAVSGSEAIYHADTRVRHLKPFEISLGSSTATVTLRSERAFVRSSDEHLGPHVEAMRNALGILCGGPASLRLERSKEVVSINSAPHDTREIGRFWEREEDVPEILQRALHLVSAATEVGRRHTLAGHFYTHGLGDRSILEHRIILLYTALEVLDESDTLSKEPVARILGIDSASADLIIRVRNGLVHNGLSLNEAVAKKAGDIRSYCPTWSPPGLDLLRARLGPPFYFWFAGLLAGYWKRALEFQGPISDYGPLGS